MAFPGGAVPADIVLPIWEEIDFAAFGYTFADVLYGGSFPIRKAAKLSLKHRGRKDVIEQDWNDMYDAMLDAELYGNSTRVLMTMYLMWRYGPNNIRVKTENGKWFNFVDNGTNGNGPITMGDATGSVLLSNSFTFEVGDVERSIKSKWEGGMFRAERYWLDQNSGSGATGGVSGATISGFSHIVYDPKDYAPPGILGVSINDGSSTLDLGFLESGSKLTLDFHEQGKTSPRHQAIPGWVDIKAEVVMWQSAFDELKYIFSKENTDVTTTFTLAPAGDKTNGGETANFQVICVNSVKPVEDYEGDEQKNLLKVAFNGRVRGASNVLFNLAANTLTLNRAGYV